MHILASHLHMFYFTKSVSDITLFCHSKPLILSLSSLKYFLLLMK